MKATTLFEGCGVAIALTLSYTWDQLVPDHISAIYLRALPTASVAGGVALVLAAVSLAGWGVVALMAHWDAARKTPVWMLLTALVPAVLIRSALTLFEVGFRIPTTLVITLVLLLPAAALWRFWPAAYRKLVNGFLAIYLCLGICILWMLPQLAMAALNHHPRESLESSRTEPAIVAPRGQTRIVWLLLDELSYDQTFEHRQPGLKLPNLDALRSQSTLFTDMQPAGYYTDEVLPAVLSGHPVEAIRSNLDGVLSVRERSGGPWERFDPRATLFADAERMGWSTAIAGWFNPYCRLFGTIVEQCTWRPESRLFAGHMSSSNTVWQNTLAPLGSKFRRPGETNLTAEHREAYQALLARGLQMIGDDRIRFVFVHLPVPHPPGIYDRVSGRLRDGGSYLDNLALADATLGEIRAAIAGTVSADNTILIVSSDHSMRVNKWRGGPYWTPEDERVFHNRFDPRPVLLVHFADGQTPQTEPQPFAELNMHGMIEEILAGRVRSGSGLDAWVTTQAKAQ